MPGLFFGGAPAHRLLAFDALHWTRVLSTHRTIERPHDVVWSQGLIPLGIFHAPLARRLFSEGAIVPKISNPVVKVAVALLIGLLTFFVVGYSLQALVALMAPLGLSKPAWWLAAAIALLSIEITLRRLFSGGAKDDDADSYLDAADHFG
jgi:hypothetical protein